MAKISKSAFVVGLLCSLTLSGAPRDVWVAAKIGNEIITNKDIERYTETVLLGDEILAGLFKKSGNVYGKFEEEKRKFVSGFYEASLRKYVSIRVIQYDALGEGVSFDSDDRKPRQFFKISKIAIEKVINDTIRREFPGQNAQHEIGKKLLENCYPHLATDTDEQIFLRWKNHLHERLREQYRENEARNYVWFKATHDYVPRYVTSKERNGFYSRNIESLKKVMADFQGSEEDLEKYFQAHPEHKPLVREISNIGLATSIMSQMIKTDLKHFEDSQTIIRDNFLSALNSDQVNEMLRLEDLAFDFSKKYATVEEIQALGRAEWDRYLSTGSFQSLVLTHLYGLAISMHQNHPDRQEVRHVFRNQLLRSFEVLNEVLLNPQTYLSKEYQKLTFEASVYWSMTKEFEKANVGIAPQNLEYLKMVQDMAAGLIRLEAKKTAMLDHNDLHIVYADLLDAKDRKKIDIFLKYKNLEVEIKKWIHTDLRERSYFNFELSGHTYLLQDAFNFIFGDNPDSSSGLEWILGD